MPCRILRTLAVCALLAAGGGAAFAQNAAAPAVEGATKAPGKEPTVQGLAARERQKACGAEWRALPAAEKAAKGPKWPQYYSRCVKRLKEQKA